MSCAERPTRTYEDIVPAVTQPYGVRKRTLTVAAERVGAGEDHFTAILQWRRIQLADK